MQITNEALWKKTLHALESLEGHTHIIHDFDVDGITGGLTLYHTLKRLGKDVSQSTKNGRAMSMRREHLHNIKHIWQPQNIIITDQDPKSFHAYEEIREYFPTENIIIIDHHKPQEYSDALFVHPQLTHDIEGHKYCSSKFIYDLCNELTDIEDLSWLTAAGILGDANARYFEPFLKEVCEYNDLEIPEDWFDAEFAKIAETIDCCSAVGDIKLLPYIMQLNKQETLQGALSLGNPAQEVKDDVDKYVKIASTLAETHGPLVWLPIESEYGIAGWITTIVSFQFPHRIFIGYREVIDEVGISGRYQDAKVHLGDLFREITESLGGSGGGHAPAAGARVPKENWEAFKTQLEKRVNQEL